MTSKKTTKRSPKKTNVVKLPTRGPAPEGMELVGGKFHPGSFKAIIFELLSDGKIHSLDEIQKAVPKCLSVSGRLNTMKHENKVPIGYSRVEGGYYLRSARRNAMKKAA